MTASILEENQGEQIKSLLGTRDYKEEVRVSKFIDILEMKRIILKGWEIELI